MLQSQWRAWQARRTADRARLNLVRLILARIKLAVVLQRVYRGHRQRKKARWMRNGGLEMIKKSRRARAVNIQRIWRGWKGRQLAAEERRIWELRKRYVGMVCAVTLVELRSQPWQVTVGP